MAIKKISSIIELGSSWANVNLEDLNSFYFIGIKEAKTPESTIDPKDVKILNFEAGIESGLENTYLTIGYITLNFDSITSKEALINNVTAMSRYLNYPSSFYIRPTDIITYDNNVLTKGTTNISININSVKLN